MAGVHGTHSHIFLFIGIYTAKDYMQPSPSILILLMPRNDIWKIKRTKNETKHQQMIL